jgi:TRAP-type C4-dicarboxylate transport system permease large subunit
MGEITHHLWPMFGICLIVLGIVTCFPGFAMAPVGWMR